MASPLLGGRHYVVSRRLDAAARTALRARVCRHIYARAGRGAVAVLDVTSNEALHQILNEWADIIPAHFDTYPLVDLEATKRMLAAQTAAKKVAAKN
jgi:hypothetical protein